MPDVESRATGAAPVPHGLTPKRRSGLSTSFGLWLDGLVKQAIKPGLSSQDRYLARSKVFEVIRLASQANQTIKHFLRVEQVRTENRRKRMREAAQNGGGE